MRYRCKYISSLVAAVLWFCFLSLLQHEKQQSYQSGLRSLQGSSDQYVAEAFECDESRIRISDNQPKVFGDSIRICVTPTRLTLDRGVVMRRISYFTFARSYESAEGTIVQDAIVYEGRESQDTLKVCDPGFKICVFTTKLKADLFASSGNVIGTGEAQMEFESPPEESDLRQLQDQDVQYAGVSEIEFTFAVSKSSAVNYRKSPYQVWNDLSKGARYGIALFMIAVLILGIFCFFYFCLRFYKMEIDEAKFVDGHFPREVDLDSQASFFKTLEIDNLSAASEELPHDEELGETDLFDDEDGEYKVGLNGIPEEEENKPVTGQKQTRSTVLSRKRPEEHKQKKNKTGTKKPKIRKKGNKKKQELSAKANEESVPTDIAQDKAVPSSFSNRREPAGGADASSEGSVSESSFACESEGDDVSSVESALSIVLSEDESTISEQEVEKKELSKISMSSESISVSSVEIDDNGSECLIPPISKSAISSADSVSVDVSSVDDDSSKDDNQKEIQIARSAISLRSNSRPVGNSVEESHDSKESSISKSSGSRDPPEGDKEGGDSSSDSQSQRVPGSKSTIMITSVGSNSISGTGSISAGNDYHAGAQSGPMPGAKTQSRVKTSLVDVDGNTSIIIGAADTTTEAETMGDASSYNLWKDSYTSTKDIHASKATEVVDNRRGFNKNYPVVSAIDLDDWPSSDDEMPRDSLDQSIDGMGADDDDDDDSVNFYPDEYDIALDAPNHTGTMVFDMAVRKAAAEGAAFSNKIFKRIEADVEGRKFFLKESAGQLDFWRDCTPQETKNRCRKAYKVQLLESEKIQNSVIDDRQIG